MKLGLQINRFDFHDSSNSIHDDLGGIATAAEDAGFDSMWVMDHFWQLAMIGRPEEPMMEAYTTLGFLAGITKRVMLGAMVTGVIYREPALLIKAVTALDVVSGGRAYFGVGAGWFAEEAHGMGFMDPLNSHRFERLEDVLKLTHQMWKDDDSAFDGQHYRLPKPINHPQPVTKPHPPILVGGSGEQKTLRFVAQYGDACNLFAGGDLSDITHKLEVLKGHCKDVGRDYDEIEKTALVSGMRINDAAADPDKALDILKRLHALGVSHAIFGVSQELDLNVYKKLSELVETVHSL